MFHTWSPQMLRLEMEADMKRFVTREFWEAAMVGGVVAIGLPLVIAGSVAAASS